MSRAVHRATALRQTISSTATIQRDDIFLEEKAFGEAAHLAAASVASEHEVVPVLQDSGLKGNQFTKPIEDIILLLKGQDPPGGTDGIDDRQVTRMQQGMNAGRRGELVKKLQLYRASGVTRVRVRRRLGDHDYQQIRPGKATRIVGDYLAAGNNPDLQGELRERWADSLDEQARQAIDQYVASIPGEDRPSVVILGRNKENDPHRNMTPRIYRQLVERLRGNYRILKLGQAVGDLPADIAHTDFSNHYAHESLQGEDAYRRQAYFMHALTRDRGVIGQIGVKSGAIDLGALVGVPSIYLEYQFSQKRGRMAQWSDPDRLPGYSRVQTGSFGNEDVDAAAMELSDLELGRVEAIVDGWAAARAHADDDAAPPADQSVDVEGEADSADDL